MKAVEGKQRVAHMAHNHHESGTALPRLGGMSEHALTVLDFHRALEHVAGRATSEAGREAVRSMRPRTDRMWVKRELTRVSETQAFLDARSTWSVPEIPDCVPLFELLAVEGSVLDFPKRPGRIRSSFSSEYMCHPWDRLRKLEKACTPLALTLALANTGRSMAAKMPIVTEPVSTVAINPKQAPISIEPSVPRLILPALSVINSP